MSEETKCRRVYAIGMTEMRKRALVTIDGRDQKPTREWLARRLGTSRKQVSAWEHGETMGMGMLCRIADVLGCSVDALLRGHPQFRHEPPPAGAGEDA